MSDEFHFVARRPLSLWSQIPEMLEWVWDWWPNGFESSNKRPKLSHLIHVPQTMWNIRMTPRQLQGYHTTFHLIRLDAKINASLNCMHGTVHIEWHQNANSNRTRIDGKTNQMDKIGRMKSMNSKNYYKYVWIILSLHMITSNSRNISKNNNNNNNQNKI